MHFAVAAQTSMHFRNLYWAYCSIVPGSWLSRRSFLQSSLGSALLSLSPALRAAVLSEVSDAAADSASVGQLKVQFSFGHRAPALTPFTIRLATSGGVQADFDAWQGSAGAGRVESRSVLIRYPMQEVRVLQNLQAIWEYLIAHSDADTVRRLMSDPACRNDARAVTLVSGAGGTSGFTVTIDQLECNRAMWIPALDLYMTTGDSPVPFEECLRENAAQGQVRILEQVQRDPEASYEQYTALWEDMGNPAYAHPRQGGPGHIVCLCWDSAIAKFGIDRGAGVWNDYGNPDRFRFWFGFANLAEGIVPYWKGQHLMDGLPIITTVFEREGVRYEVEQFSYPLDGPPQTRSGEVAMLLLQKVTVTNLSGRARALDIRMVHQRIFPADEDAEIAAESGDGRIYLLNKAHHEVMLAVHAPRAKTAWVGVADPAGTMKGAEVVVSLDLAVSDTREFFVTLPSQLIRHEDRQKLDGIDYATARSQTLKFWSDYVERGATFTVPEKTVNDLFRASLWHALRLPRRHYDGTMDLPFSNFAYSQTGTPWPINQAVYVDYMLYGLRGYHAIAAEEIAAIYHNNQEFSGHVNGNANWLSYTPGMVYAAARNFLLSGDRESIESVLPATMRALDYSLEQVRGAAGEASSVGELKQVRGLVDGPLNDLTGSGYWAFNQAYLYAAFAMMGLALERLGHARAAECARAADQFRATIEQSFRYAAVASPLVQLRDHSWTTYVPSQATHTGRNFEQWYPSDVDTGPVHLVRLNAIDAHDPLAGAMLSDMEDNLFLHGWGTANEPVYNQHATAYLLRDDVKPVIRAFYSYMASAFSHSALEPVEHRWCWGQYFGPPSTDGAWFELYRNMLVREVDRETLLLAQATPRSWLRPGTEIVVREAPTWFGNVSFTIRSGSQAEGDIEVSLQLQRREPLKNLLVRIRQSEGRRLQRVTVNGGKWQDFDREKEWVRIANPGAEAYSITAGYSC